MNIYLKQTEPWCVKDFGYNSESFRSKSLYISSYVVLKS